LAEFTIRPAVRDDFSEIRSLINTVHINPTGLDWRRFLVAISLQKELLGCGQIKYHADGSRELASIAVCERARGKGIARAVIMDLLEKERTRPIYLMCRARLELFYAKFEFRIVTMEAMPPYFRRISRIAQLLNLNTLAEDRLIVMRLD
jgi:N-acetylglutamate synthase-like GNAT family acetyltransferase